MQAMEGQAKAVVDKACLELEFARALQGIDMNDTRRSGRNNDGAVASNLQRASDPDASGSGEGSEDETSDESEDEEAADWRPTSDSGRCNRTQRAPTGKDLPVDIRTDPQGVSAAPTATAIDGAPAGGTADHMPQPPAAAAGSRLCSAAKGSHSGATGSTGILHAASAAGAAGLKLKTAKWKPCAVQMYDTWTDDEDEAPLGPPTQLPATEQQLHGPSTRSDKATPITGAALPPRLSSSGLTAGKAASTPAPTSDDEDGLTLLERALALQQQRQTALDKLQQPQNKTVTIRGSGAGIGLEERRGAYPSGTQQHHNAGKGSWPPACIHDAALSGTSGLEASIRQVCVAL